MFVAWRDLRFARGRFLLIATVVALISVLVGFLSGLTGGLAAQNVSGILGFGADRVVLGASAPGASPTYADSTITAKQLATWEDAPRVRVRHGARCVADARRERRASGSRSRSSPPRMAHSVRPHRTSEIALSAPAAAQLGAGLGDTVTIAETDFTVTAIGGDDWYSHTPVVRTTLDGLAEPAGPHGRHRRHRHCAPRDR